MIAIRLEQLGERYVPVDGAKFYTWLQTPDLTWQDVVSMVARKRKQLNKTHNHKIINIIWPTLIGARSALRSY